MKKLLTLFGLIAMSALLFVGCQTAGNQMADGKSDTKAPPSEPLAIVEKVNGIDYEDGTITIVGDGTWGCPTRCVEFTLKNVTDFSKGIKITGYVKDWTGADIGTKVIMIEDDVHGSEMNFWLKDKSAPLEIKKFQKLWSIDGSITDADLSKIVTVKIDLQLDSGTMIIENIEPL